jgi:hypothetical protein
MNTATKNTMAVEAALAEALKALNTASVIGDSNSGYSGALAVAHLAVKEAHRAVLCEVDA